MAKKKGRKFKMPATRPPKYVSPESLGKLKFKLTPDPINSLGYGVLATVFLGLGVTCFWFSAPLLAGFLRGTPVDSRGIIGAIVGGLLVAVAIFVLYLMTASLSDCIAVCEHGYYTKKRGRQTVVGWEDIILMEEVTAHVGGIPNAPGVLGLVVTRTETFEGMLRWHRCDHQVYEYPMVTVRNLHRFEIELKRKLKEAEIPWQKVEEHV